MLRCKDCKFVYGADLDLIISEEDIVCGCGKTGRITINNNKKCKKNFIKRDE